MTLEIVEEDSSCLAAYATVPIGFEVASMFDADAIDSLRRGEEAEPVPISPSYVKDYDTYAGGHPTEWPTRFDISTWVILAAYLDGIRVAGAAAALDHSRVELARDAGELGLLWDLRVAPAMRHRGIGSALLRAVEAAALRRGVPALRVETQQVNVPACRFYQRHGFVVERVTPAAYASLPDEVQLLWVKRLERDLDHPPDAR
jgi:ribosomal protein S18 acetylase RimI-like enzyme